MQDDTAPTPPAGREIPATRTVLLEHTTPDGGVHLDWLIERPGIDAEHRLIAFRCTDDPTTRSAWVGERLPDHRARYLEYEGPISGNRGSVRRVWSKPCVLQTEAADGLSLTIEPLLTSARTLHLRRVASTRWSFQQP